MKRKLAAVIAVVMISMGLLACGSNDSAPTDTVETAAETEAPEEITEASEEADIEPEAENEEVPEQEESVPEWYMDEEGIKSDELGIMIRRDSAEWEKCGLSGILKIYLLKEKSIINFNFECCYYEGDIDSYVSEHKGMEKAILENVSYAFGNDTAVFVGNGMIFSVVLSERDIEDIWEKGLSFYEGDDMDYLAYFKEDTLYCPALGIKFSGEEGYNGIGISCSNIKYTDGIYGGKIKINNDGFFGDGSAEEILNQKVKQQEDYGRGSAIDETVERDLGKYKFMGKGVSQENGSSEWYFLSDEVNGSINIFYTEDYKLEDYLSVIEELK